MPRGAKEDLTVTRNLREAGFFLNRRSFISLDGHLFLEGFDKGRTRERVFRKHRNRCVVCGVRLHPDAPMFHPHCGEWHHPKNCDCVGCSELRCSPTTGRKCHAHRTEGFHRDAKEYANERSTS
jgi:hypothetical protein